MLGNLIPVLRPKDVAGDNVKNRDGVNEFLVRIRTVVITEDRTSKRDQIEVSGPLTNRFDAIQIKATTVDRGHDPEASFVRGATKQRKKLSPGGSGQRPLR